MAEQEILLREIKSLSDSVRKKTQALKLGLSERDKFLEETFKPIVDPLNKLNQNLSSKIESKNNDKRDESTSYSTEMISSDEIDEEEAEEGKGGVDLKENGDISMTESPTNLSILSHDITDKGPLTRKYILKMLHHGPKSSKYHVFGARLEKDGIHIGDSFISINERDQINIKEENFKGTVGLFELLFELNPKKYSKNDLNNFKQICLLTNLHRKGYSQNTPIHRNKSNKYKNIISRLFSTKRGKRRGKGMSMKSVYDTNVIYYNDINKLVDRMKLLYESVQAGHSGLDNEIVALTEELKRTGYIDE